MSNNDSLDEETKRILAEVDTNDSKELDKPKDTIDKKLTQDEKNEYKEIVDDTDAKDVEWETNNIEDKDEEW